MALSTTQTAPAWVPPAWLGMGWLGLTRLAIGLGQGLVGFALLEAQYSDWAEYSPAFAAVALVAIFVPVLVIGGLGAMRGRTLAVWTGAATVLLAGLGWHDQARDLASYTSWPGPAVLLAAAAIVFIVHHLIAAADESRRIVAPYERYFDLAVRHAAQLALALAFIGALWAVLGFGAQLFRMVDIDALNDLIAREWFAVPVTTLAFAAAIHVTDTQSGVVRAVQALGLTLLSWLMPVMTALIGAFLAALPFITLEPLWATGNATALLLGGAAILIVLINAAYQDGAGKPPVLVLRITARVAALLLVPLVGLAAYALSLRVSQHGLTPDRVWAAACVLVGLFLAVAYAAAAVVPRWLKPIEMANVAAAVVVLAALLALFTPVADPARLAVADQLTRLRDGKIAVADFDFSFLRYDSARYGRAALDVLRADRSTERAAEIADHADIVATAQSRWEADDELTKRETELLFTAVPAGATLPADFIEQAETLEDGQLSGCRTTECPATLVDVDGDGQPEVVVENYFNQIVVYRREGDSWRHFAYSYVNCRPRDDFRRGLASVETRAPVVSDLVIDGVPHQLQIVRDGCSTRL